MFTPLSKSEIKQITELLLRKVRSNLTRRGMNIEVSENAMDLLTDLGYDPQFGARPLKRVIQKDIINELSKFVLSGQFSEGDTIYIDTDAKGFTFSEKGFTGRGKVQAPADNGNSKTEKIDPEKKKQLDELMKATRDVEDAVKDIGNPEE